ncbi:C1orf146 [Branchiostoma lanceolatum]|uniref:C1orf146 protein n=1 Tax=Branchiostoma lanceolatum TaxID=7740 RepID=A0A8K0E8G5_BRALA|nr:C1orf146 [Branchiostoma lanceolatum]
MDEPKGDVTSNQQWPVIVNASLQNSDVTRLLQQQKHKTRVSDTTLRHTCIFPLSGVAFMIVPLNESLTDWPPSADSVLDGHLVDRIEKFLAVHRNCYLLTTAALHGHHEMTALSALQNKFMDRKLYLLPAHNASECVQSMETIAKATYKPSCETIRQRLCKLLTNQVSEDIVLHIISRLGLSQHECLVLQQGRGTLGRIALASREELLDCSLDSDTVDRVIKFFEKDCVVV